MATSNFVIEDQHPFIKQMIFYYRQYDALREECQSLSSYSFQSQEGLRMDVPSSWPITQAIRATCDLVTKGAVLIIYSDTANYRQIYEVLGNNAQYMAWTEIYTAMHRATEDVRLIQHVKDVISNAQLTIFMNAKAAARDVIEQVKKFADGCLIILG